MHNTCEICLDERRTCFESFMCMYNIDGYNK